MHPPDWSRAEEELYPIFMYSENAELPETTNMIADLPEIKSSNSAAVS
jgi:hypothetical protein